MAGAPPEIPRPISSSPEDLLEWANQLANAIGLQFFIMSQAGPNPPLIYTVAGVPDPAVPAQIIYVSNEAGGAVPAFSDGTNWRRVTDRAIVS
jgi:hypothetical protein